MPKQSQWYHQRSLITDHITNKYSNNKNAWNTVEIIKMWHRDVKWANAVTDRLAWHTVATNLQIMKNTQYIIPLPSSPPEKKRAKFITNEGFLFKYQRLL